MRQIDGHKNAIIGSSFIWGKDGEQIEILVYDAEIIRENLMYKDGMDFQEAREFIEYNIEGAYVGPDTPIIVWKYDSFYGEMDD